LPGVSLGPKERASADLAADAKPEKKKKTALPSEKIRLNPAFRRF